MRLASLVVILVLLFCGTSFAAWYQGGTLGSSKIADWKKASQANKIASAAAWANNSPYIAARLDRWKRGEPYMQHTRRLVECINYEIRVSNQYDAVPTSKFATACMQSFGWYKRR